MKLKSFNSSQAKFSDWESKTQMSIQLQQIKTFLGFFKADVKRQNLQYQKGIL